MFPDEIPLLQNTLKACVGRIAFMDPWQASILGTGESLECSKLLPFNTMIPAPCCAVLARLRSSRFNIERTSRSVSDAN